MSTYKFDISKRHIVALEDSSQFASTIPETHPDSSTEIAAQQDIEVKVYLDDVEKHSVTLTDSGATLQFDADVSTGDHVIKIKSPKDPIAQTDICVDRFWIGTTQCVASQWDFNNQVLGTTSTLRQKVSVHNDQQHDYVWWGQVVHNDSSLDLPGPFYRAGIVSDHQAEWHFHFTRTAAGKIWTNNPGDTDHLLWDSTAQHTYYFVAKGTDQATVDAAYETYENEVVAEHSVFDDSSTTAGTPYADSTANTRKHVHVGLYEGPGTYQFDSDNDLKYVSDSIDDASEDANNIVCITAAEHGDMIKQHWYHRNYTVTPITVT